MAFSENTKMGLGDNTRPILLFDGICNLCNWAVHFVMRNEKSQDFLFASIQSETGHKLLKQFGEENLILKTVYVISNGKLLKKADAILFVTSHLKKPYYFLKFAKIFPVTLLNWLYDLISKNRYKLFGKRDTCRAPSVDEKARFIG
jgi:predicted DCC family thiol-disulfide oxidoreductase YuxK